MKAWLSKTLSPHKCALDSCNNQATNEITAILYEDSYVEGRVAAFCSNVCRDIIYSSYWDNRFIEVCILCDRSIVNYLDKGSFDYLKLEGKQVRICIKCCEEVVLRDGQSRDDFVDAKGMITYCEEDFRSLTPKEAGYIVVTSEWNLKANHEFRENVFQYLRTNPNINNKVNRVEVLKSVCDQNRLSIYHEISKCALGYIYKKCKVICIINNGIGTLWCYGMYHDKARAAALCWMLCSKSLVKAKGIGYSKDVSRLIGKMVYSSRNDCDVWASDENNSKQST